METSKEYTPVSRFYRVYDFLIAGSVSAAIVVGVPAAILFAIEWLMP